MNSLRTKSFLSIALLLWLTLLGCTDSGPAVAVDKFQRLIEKGDTTEAASMISGEILAVMPPEKMKAAMGAQTQEIAKKGGIDSVEILSEEIVGQTATVRVQTHYGDGTTSKEEEIQMTKIDGEWMLTPSMDK